MFQWTLISPEERDICTGWLPDLIHTSCRSESSNISLVVLDKVSLCPNSTHPRLRSAVHFSREPSELIKLLPLSPRFTLSGWRPTWLSPWSWGG